MAKGWVHVAEDRCKGCNLCVDACPPHVLALSTDRFNAKGYRPGKIGWRQVRGQDDSNE